MPALSAHGEPEAVSATIQAGLTRDAHERRQAEVQAKWGAERSRILAVLDRLEREPWAAPIQGNIKQLRHDLRKMGERLS